MSQENIELLNKWITWFKDMHRSIGQGIIIIIILQMVIIALLLFKL